MANALKIKATRNGYRRAGYGFSIDEERTIPFSELTDEQIEALKADKKLIVIKVDDPDVAKKDAEKKAAEKKDAKSKGKPDADAEKKAKEEAEAKAKEEAEAKAKAEAAKKANGGNK
ncbi:MAG: hypothetical protein GC185_01855 [Alphaproteobacteria bacterium]|nr:hypothetical protein [Alphaproteobacteria bacterium]